MWVLEVADGYIPYDGQIVTRAQALEMGLKRFFTGKPCQYGHLSERYLRGQCIACNAVATARWHSHNPEKAAGYRASRILTEAQKDAARRRAAERYARIPEICRATTKAAVARDPEKTRLRRAAYFEAHRERLTESKRASVRRRRARKAQVGGDHTAQQVSKLLVVQGYRCATCRKSIKTAYEADHIMPISKGGSNDIHNIQLLCPPCNRRKGSKHPIVWARENGRLL